MRYLISNVGPGGQANFHVDASRYDGANLWQGSYLKLANYHTPVCDPYLACIGTHPPSSVIHDRVIRGTVAARRIGGAVGRVSGAGERGSAAGAVI